MNGPNVQHPELSENAMGVNSRQIQPKLLSTNVYRYTQKLCTSCWIEKFGENLSS